MTAPPDAGRACPLSPAQLSIWLHQQVATEPGLYIEHICYDLRGDLDDERLAGAVRDALAAHPSFGAAVETERGVPLLIPGRYAVEVQRRDVADADLARVVARESITGVSLGGGPMSRCLLLHVTPRHRVLLLVWHHLVTDGVGVRAFLRSLAQRWDGAPAHPGAEVGAANRSLAALAAGGDVRERAEQIALRLADLDPLPLPRRPGMPSGSACVAVGPDRGAVPGLAAAALTARVTVPMLLSAAFQRAAGDVLGLRDFLLGCVTTGRVTPESADAVGCFVNTVLLRGTGDPAVTDAALVRSSATGLAGAIADQDVPFGAVAARLLRGVRPRPVAFPQLYLSMDAPLPLKLSGVDCARRWTSHAQAKFDVALVVEFAPGGVRGTLHHRPDVLAPDRAARLVDAFLTRLRGLAGPVAPETDPGTNGTHL